VGKVRVVSDTFTLLCFNGAGLIRVGVAAAREGAVGVAVTAAWVEVVLMVGVAIALAMVGNGAVKVGLGLSAMALMLLAVVVGVEATWLAQPMVKSAPRSKAGPSAADL
jgi:hypothetical protein